MSSMQCQSANLAEVRALGELLQRRKTRRFGCGMELPAGPLRYRSTTKPIPLSREEVHWLLYAGVGESGRHLADMQYLRRPNHEDGQGMAVMGFDGRTVPSACAANTTKLFISDDEGLWFVSRVAHPDAGGEPELVRLQPSRLAIPRQLPFMLSFNQWYANRPGSLYIVPVTEVARVYINLLLVLLSEEYGYFIVDTDNGGAACGLDDFRASRGGHLHDDPAKRRMLTLRDVDAAISDTALQEQGAVCQNMFLMEQALGLGGGIHSVGSGRHVLGWEPQIFPGLGFHFRQTGVNGVRANPVGVPSVWEGPCPPFEPSMESAVFKLVGSKFGLHGLYGSNSKQPWVQRAGGKDIVPHDPMAVDATIRFCEYVHRTYGRFPAHVDAFKTVVAFQAHHVDVEFYDHFYPPEMLPQAHRDHLAAWHGIESLEEMRLTADEGKEVAP